MDTVTLDTFRRNAFRILGLPAAATQEQIDAAARLMRLHSAGDAPSTPNDALWLGPVRRLPPDVDYAVMRLTDPESRTAERVWWFWNQPPATNGPTVPPVSPSAVAKVRHRHDEALTGLCRLLTISAGTGSLERWRELLAEFRRIGASDAYLQWLLAVENAGEFEKRASPEEVAAFQVVMAGQASTALVPMADEFLDGQFYGSAGRIVGMLNEASAGQGGPSQEAAVRIVNRLEDTLVGQCNECMAQVSAAWKSKKINILKPACVRAIHQCQSTIEIICQEVLKWSVADQDRSQRVRGQVVKVYAHIADAYEACLDKYSARQTLIKSVNAAQGTPMEPRLRQRIDSLAGARPVATPSGGGQNRGWQFGFVKSMRIPFIIIGFILLRLCATLNTTSNSSSYNAPDQNLPKLSNRDLDQIIKDLNASTQPGGNLPQTNNKSFSDFINDYDKQHPRTPLPTIPGRQPENPLSPASLPALSINPPPPATPLIEGYPSGSATPLPINTDSQSGPKIPPLTVPPVSPSLFQAPGSATGSTPGLTPPPSSPGFTPTNSTPFVPGLSNPAAGRNR